MLSTKVDIQELPSRFTELISLSMAGTEVIVTESNIPRARLVPLSPGQSRVAGLHSGAIKTTADFDVPLPDEFWGGGPRKLC